MSEQPTSNNQENQELQHNPPKAGQGLALLALLVGAAGIALGYAGHQKNTQQELIITKLTQDLHQHDQQRQQDHTQLSAQIQQIQSALISQEQVKQLAQQQIENLRLHETFNEAVSQAIAQLPKPVTQDDVVQLIEQATQNFSNTEKRFGEALQLELGKVQQQHAQSQALLADANELTSKITLVYREKSQALETLTEEKLQAIQRAQATLAYSAPVENALKLALSAAEQGHYQASHALIQEAIASFDLFNLSEKPYADLKEQLLALAPKYQALHEEQIAQQTFDALFQSLPQWKFKAPDAENMLKTQDVNQASDWADKLKIIGNNVLANTVTITKGSDETISWVNSSENLRAIIRENARLDLAFARNALQVGDTASFERVRERLLQAINLYFDVTDPSVAQAIETLSQWKVQTPNHQELSAILQALSALKAQ
ncbi:MAG: hypothetical protein Q4B71_02655 [Cardiobacteriaceae bacterium]|nr:hypothetical protein [Cardiobacteriaceae bacterium]